jgi:hypothetical protein
MNEVTLILSVEEVNAVLAVLGELPSKTGAWTLLVKIKEQVDSQTEKPTN